MSRVESRISHIQHEPVKSYTLNYMSLRTLWKPIALAAVCTAMIFAFHATFPSVINNLNQTAPTPYDELAAKMWRLHSNHPAFAGRPLTSLLIKQLHDHVGLSFPVSFSAINFSLLFIAGVLLYFVARQHDITRRNALLSLPIFYVSFTILFSFFRSIDSYDEPIQYCLIFLTLFLINKQKWLLGGIALFLALLARETTVFLFPALLLYFFKNQIPLKIFLTSKEGWKKIFFLLIPLCAFLLAEQLILQEKNLSGGHVDYFVNNRFTHWRYNIQNNQFAIETLVSIFLTLAPPLFLFMFHKNRPSSPTERNARRAFLLTAIINTVIVLVSARAREARLFALPLVFLWPLLGKYASTMIAAIRENLLINFKRLKKVIALCVWILTLPLLYRFATTVYRPTHSGGFNYGYQCYFFVTLSLLLLGILLWLSFRFKDRPSHS